MLKTVKRKRQLNKKGAVAAALAVLLILAAVFTVVHSQRASHQFTAINKEVAKGIDVSSHNGKINWKDVRSEADFAFIRVGYRGYEEGSINLDKKAKYNLKQANKADIPVGVYFYSQATNEQEAQEEADFVINAIKPYAVALPVVIDFEYPNVNGKKAGRLYAANLSSKENAKLINAFCKRVSDAGYTPGLYASSSVLHSRIRTNSLNKDIVIWVADYHKKNTYTGSYSIWQYSNKGSCKGVSSKYVDTNYLYNKQ